MKYTHEVLTKEGELAYHWDESTGNLYKANTDEICINVGNKWAFTNACLTLQRVE